MHPGTTLVVPGDLTRAEDRKILVDRVVQEFGHIDVLIPAHGCADFSTFAQATDEEVELQLRQHMHTNFFSVALLTRAFLPYFARGVVAGGSIVFVSSCIAQAGFAQLWAYAASKAALEGFMRVLAIEIADQGITCNAIAPGPTQTKMWANALQDNACLTNAVGVKMLPRLLSGYFAAPADIAATIVHIAMSEGTISGQSIIADSGYMIS
jgi:NAD(P)-dependent dehydrogenase (short-subunit alcohol dehydrogenase family)